MKKLILLISVIALSSCAMINTEFKHPVTSQTARCEAAGWGWIGTPMALIIYYECKQKMIERGFLMAEDAGNIQTTTVDEK